MKITIPYEYTKQVIPKHCRNPRGVVFKKEMSVTINGDYILEAERKGKEKAGFEPCPLLLACPKSCSGSRLTLLKEFSTTKYICQVLNCSNTYFRWSWGELNPRPVECQSTALPLSYSPTYLYSTTPKAERVNTPLSMLACGRIEVWRSEEFFCGYGEDGRHGISCHGLGVQP